MDRLTDAYIDGALDRSVFEQRKASLLHDQAAAKERLKEFESKSSGTLARIENFPERTKSAPDVYQTALLEEKRTLVKDITSNLTLDGKKPVVVLQNAHQLIANRPVAALCCPERGVPRTWTRLLTQLVTLFAEHPEDASVLLNN